MAKYAILIKTDSYAGNFERELCAHLTGHIGECGVGDNYVDESIAEKFENYVAQEEDEGCYRPVNLGYDFGYSNDDVIIWFNEKPTEELIDIIKERLETFNETKLKLESWNKDVIGIKEVKILTFKRKISVSEEII